MWHVAPESTSQQVLGSPIPTLPTNSCSVLLRWCVTGLSVLDVPVAPFGPPASDPVFTAVAFFTTMAFWPLGSTSSCSTSGSSDSSGSSGSSPSSTSRSLPLPRPLTLPRPPFPLPLGAAAGLAVAFGFAFGVPLGLFDGSLLQQSLARCPDLPQWLHLGGLGHSLAM